MKTIIYTAERSEIEWIADRVSPALHNPDLLSGWFDGYTLRENEPGVWSYHASKKSHSRLQAALSKHRLNGEQPATDRQINYLASLIRQDPGAAMTVGASADGVHVRENLSAPEASRLIDMMLNS